MVLYNGTENWRVPENIADLIEHSIPDDYIPRFRYHTIVEKDISDETLFELDNLIAAVIYFDKQRNTQELDAAIEKIVYMIRNEELIDVKQFAVWAKRLFTFSEKEALSTELNTLQEVKPMLTLLAEKIKAEGWAEGKAEGKAEGRVEGRREVAIKLLKSGYPRAQVAELTGLSKAEMDKLEG